MSDLEDFGARAALADDLIEKATKEQLADVARLLALDIGYYHARFGDVPQETLLRMVLAESLDGETRQLLHHGMQNLVSALAEVMGLDEDGKDDEIHGGERVRPRTGLRCALAPP